MVELVLGKGWLQDIIYITNSQVGLKKKSVSTQANKTKEDVRIKKVIDAAIIGLQTIV